MIVALSSFCIDSQEVSDYELGKQKRNLRTILKLRPKQWNVAIDRGGTAVTNRSFWQPAIRKEASWSSV